MARRTEGKAILKQGPSTAWERAVVHTAKVFATVTLIVSILLAFGFTGAGIPIWLSLPLSLLIAYLVYAGMTRKIRRRRRILARPFPTEWEEILQREVVFFRALEPEDQMRFRRDLQVFLGEKLITGIGFDLDTTTRVLTAASAVIPIFGFPDWEWDQISEVLVYPGRFDQSYDFEGGNDRNTLGMVGTGALNRLMILSKPDLHAGFRNSTDKKNVGVHEFAHLVDKSDGVIDGLPGVGLEQAAIGPWIELVRRKMEEIRRNDSDINPYGLTNEAEFFAVASEYFFERPGLMERKHPELFAMLSKVFSQNLGERAAALARERKRGRPKFGRNSPCPCGSGVKYKKCCLDRSRRSPR
ncbi:MAG: peptidase [Acidobacteria bacterium]|nr:MAG: peptidase [Acidobacteriota bacterium]